MDYIQIIKDFVDAQNEHDARKCVSFFAGDFVRFSAETQWKPMGKENYVDMTERFTAAFPDYRWEIEHIAADGNFVFLQYRETGTWTGEWKMPGNINIPAPGNAYASLALITFEVGEDGLIHRYHYHTDNGFVSAYPFLLKARVQTLNEELN